jgi:hypothetical protein
MTTELESSPYQAPAAQGGEQQAPVLRDPRWLGGVAIAAVSAQCVVGIWSSFVALGTPLAGKLMAAVITLSVLSLVFYLFWLHRCAANVLRMNRRSQVKPGWSVICHFIPFLQWVEPCLVLLAVARDTFVYRPAKWLEWLVVIWWPALVVRLICLQWSTDSWSYLLWLATTLVAWVLFVIVVTRISRRQAFFQWSDVPAMQRAVMVPRPTGERPPIDLLARGIPPKRVYPKPVSPAARLVAEDGSVARDAAGESREGGQ